MSNHTCECARMSIRELATFFKNGVRLGFDPYSDLVNVSSRFDFDSTQYELILSLYEGQYSDELDARGEAPTDGLRCMIVDVVNDSICHESVTPTVEFDKLIDREYYDRIFAVLMSGMNQFIDSFGDDSVEMEWSCLHPSLSAALLNWAACWDVSSDSMSQTPTVGIDDNVNTPIPTHSDCLHDEWRKLMSSVGSTDVMVVNSLFSAFREVKLIYRNETAALARATFRAGDETYEVSVFHVISNGHIDRVHFSVLTPRNHVVKCAKVVRFEPGTFDANVVVSQVNDYFRDLASVKPGEEWVEWARFFSHLTCAKLMICTD